MEEHEQRAGFQRYLDASAEVRAALEALGWVEPSPEEILEACRETRKKLVDERRSGNSIST